MGKVDDGLQSFRVGGPKWVARARTALRPSLGGGERSYGIQRVYVALMFDVIGRLLEASSLTDREVMAEVKGFPEGYVVGFSLLDGPLGMRLEKRGQRLVRLDSQAQATLEITFKHVSHAFAVLSFQESTAQAFANGRAVTQGDIALAMRFVRILNRMQAIALPSLIAERALKAPLPILTVRERTRLSAQLYGRVVRSLARRDIP